MNAPDTPRVQRLKREKVVLANIDQADALGPSIVATLVGYTLHDLNESDLADVTAERRLAQACSAILKAIAIAIAHDSASPLDSATCIELNDDEAALGLSLVASLLDGGTDLLEDVREARESFDTRISGPSDPKQQAEGAS